MKKLKIILYLLLLGLLISCSSPADTTAGTSSDVDIEVAMLLGRVVDTSTVPIQGVEVRLFDSSKSDTIAVDTVYSDETGEYVFAEVKRGRYHILAQYNDTTKASLNHLDFHRFEDTVINLDLLELSITGSIGGRISNHKKSQLVHVYIPGTSHMGSVGDDGKYVLSGIPPDSGYTVAIERPGYMRITIEDVIVIASDTTILNSVSLTPNDVPRNLKMDFDSTINVVTVTWEHMPKEEIVGYYISRKDSLEMGILPSALHEFTYTDTLYVDTLHDVLFSLSDSITFKYQVQGVKQAGENRTELSDAVYIKAGAKNSSAVKAGIELLPLDSSTQLIGLEPQTIRWTYTGDVDSVKVYWSLNGSPSWNPLSGTILNEGEFTWEYVYNQTVENCQFRVVSANNPKVVGLSNFFNITAVSTDNIIKNGDFTEKFAHWVLTQESTTDGNFDFNTGAMIVDVLQTGEKPWQFSVYQRDLALQRNNIYKISFRAKADVVKPLVVSLREFNKDPFQEKTFQLSEQWETYTGQLTMTGLEDIKDGILQFMMGDQLGKIWIDDVTLAVVGE